MSKSTFAVSDNVISGTYRPLPEHVIFDFLRFPSISSQVDIIPVISRPRGRGCGELMPASDIYMGPTRKKNLQRAV